MKTVMNMQEKRQANLNLFDDNLKLIRDEVNTANFQMTDLKNVINN